MAWPLPVVALNSGTHGCPTPGPARRLGNPAESKVFIARFLARDALHSNRRAASLQLGKAPSCLYIYDRLGSQASKARATWIRKQNKLLQSANPIT